MRESGLAELLFSLPDTVLVGVSAGSMVMTPRIGAYFVGWPSAPDEIGAPAYAIDEQTAISVVDGSVEVVSEGRWTEFG